VGHIKNIVYAEKIRNIQHLQERFTSATETVWTSPELQTVHISKCTEVSLKL
jgi:hypothetical protein